VLVEGDTEPIFEGDAESIFEGDAESIFEGAAESVFEGAAEPVRKLEGDVVKGVGKPSFVGKLEGTSEVLDGKLKGYIVGDDEEDGFPLRS